MWIVKYNPELISGSYYYYKETTGYGDPRNTTKYHIIYIDQENSDLVEVCERVKLDFPFEEIQFKWQVYSNNIVYVQHNYKYPYETLLLYSPRTGHHTLIPDYGHVAEIKYDKTGIKFYYYGKDGDTPDYSKPHIFTAKQLGNM